MYAVCHLMDYRSASFYRYWSPLHNEFRVVPPTSRYLFETKKEAEDARFGIALVDDVPVSAMEVVWLGTEEEFFSDYYEQLKKL